MLLDKGKPSATAGRKASGLGSTQIAGLPKGDRYAEHERDKAETEDRGQPELPSAVHCSHRTRLGADSARGTPRARVGQGA